MRFWVDIVFSSRLITCKWVDLLTVVDIFLPFDLVLISNDLMLSVVFNYMPIVLTCMLHVFKLWAWGQAIFVLSCTVCFQDERHPAAGEPRLVPHDDVHSGWDPIHWHPRAGHHSRVVATTGAAVPVAKRSVGGMGLGVVQWPAELAVSVWERSPIGTHRSHHLPDMQAMAQRSNTILGSLQWEEAQEESPVLRSGSLQVTDAQTT